MKIVAVNGSPRKNWNTATMLNKALQGAASLGAQTQLVHLYDLSFKGCTSCFACKTKGGKSYGRCAMRDELTPILHAIEEADALILGSPLYLGRVTGEMASFQERLLFPFYTYTLPPASLRQRKIPAAYIYTMNVPEEALSEYGYDRYIATNEMGLQVVFGSGETLLACDTLQFDDYDQVVAPRFDAVAKARRRKEVFPEDCRKAFELGIRLTAGTTGK